MSLLVFAWDVFTLRNSDSLPKNKIKELRDWQKFQGTRYEIGVAATFVRAGFELEWLDDKRTEYPHGEFIATHRLTKDKILVEVKSRHREGTYHTPGILKTKNLKLGAESLMNQAIDQLPDGMPSAIFIDLNLPIDPTQPTLETGWFQQIKEIFVRKPLNTQDNPVKYNFLVFTNYSWHYFGNEENKASG